MQLLVLSSSEGYKETVGMIPTLSFEKQESICESCSSLCTSSLEYLSAVSSSHALSETVLNFSLTLLGLVCSFHSRGTSLSDYIICRYNDIIIHIFYFVKGLRIFFLIFYGFFCIVHLIFDLCDLKTVIYIYVDFFAYLVLYLICILDSLKGEI